MKSYTPPLRLFTLSAWLGSRPARDRQDPGLDSSLWHDTEPGGPPAPGLRPGPQPQVAPLSRDEIELALDAGTRRHFPPRGETEVMRGH
jgi:hypothetical protein